MKDRRDPQRSVYRSAKGTARNKTVPIAVDDPRAAKNKLGQTIARQGAEVQIVGLDGLLLSSGGSKPTGAGGGSGNAPDPGYEKGPTIPGTDGRPPYEGGLGAIVLSGITNVSTVWSGTSLVVTFDWEYNKPANRSVTEFVLEITTSTGLVRRTPFGSFLVNKSQAAQTATLTKSLNRSTIGVFVTDITSVCVLAMDSFYNKSSTVCDATVPAYVVSIPAPTITVTQAISGYNVAYTVPTEDEFDAIDIVEYESNASTEPTGVTYSRVYFNSVSPANVITLNNNSRWVKARFSTDSGDYTAFSAAQKITPTPAVTVDTTGPTAPTGTVTGGLESSGTIGFNAFLNISWTGVVDSTLRGYRIRFRPVTDPVSNYAYVDSPGAGTSFRITGLASGTTYEVAIAAYDEFNNTSTSYQTLTGSPVSTAGSPFIGTNISTTGYFEAGVAGTDTGVFRFGYGVDTGKRGLIFNTNNYWYIDSAQSASLKVGGANNYITWNGASLVVAGDLQAQKGSFSGNVNIASGASIFSGTLTGNTVTDSANTGGSLSSAGYILNSTGITFSNGLAGDSLRQTTIAASSGLLTTNSANIGGWLITPGKISKTQANQGTISLNSAAGYISVTSDAVANQTSGINSPANESSVVFWGGAQATSGVSSAEQLAAAPFRVTLAGNLFASSAEITGVIKASGGGFGTFASGTLTQGWVIDEEGIVAEGPGRIKIGNYSLTSNSSTDLFIFDDTTGETILATESLPTGTEDPKRIFLGDVTRHVEVAKSALLSGNGTTVALPSNNTTVLSAYRSGGLRNIYTVANGQLSTSGTGNILEYPSALKGDILVVYNPNLPTANGEWNEIVATYINTRGNTGITYYYATYTEDLNEEICITEPTSQGTTSSLPANVSPDTAFTVTQNLLEDTRTRGYYSTISTQDALDELCLDAATNGICCASETPAPVISTSSTITTGNSGASIVVASTGFKTTVSAADFTISTGTTSLTLSSITNTSSTSKTLVFTGTITAGTLQITANASAFNPIASSASNTLSLVAQAITPTPTPTGTPGSTPTPTPTETPTPTPAPPYFAPATPGPPYFAPPDFPPAPPYFAPATPGPAPAPYFAPAPPYFAPATPGASSLRFKHSIIDVININTKKG